ncbi:hypothetical protein HUT17_05225 (plasmid) [Nocardiopsis flavescens]|nr:hypothetical protein HUT17_05225 [Nocardiopsis flavescens]
MSAAVLAIAAAGVLAASPASAETVPCSTDSTNSTWNPKCDRRTKDEDEGGVSGSVRVYYSGNTSYYASIRFEAKGEHVYLTNQTTTSATLILSTTNDHGQWIMPVYYTLGARSSDYVQWPLDESRPVTLTVCVSERGCASLSTLKS